MTCSSTWVLSKLGTAALCGFWQQSCWLLRLSGVLRTSAGLGKVGVGAFQTRVLIAMPDLSGEAGIAIVAMVFGFGCAFGAVLIVSRN
jgi:hypothetical protein